MRKKIIKYLLPILFIFSIEKTFAQDTWDLRRCVDYAMQNNITVQQADVQARLAALQTKLSQNQAYPTLGFNTQAGYQFGRNIDPTTNLFTNQKVFFQSYNVQAGVTLFNFFNIKNNLLFSKENEKAYKLGVGKARNDIALNVAAAYLQTLLSIEQANIAKVQIDQTTAQLNNTQKLVQAGSMPELNAAQLEAQLATDSSNYIAALGTADQNKISLIALLNLDEATPFNVATPDVDKIPIPPLSELDPAYVYQLAISTQPLQQSDSVFILANEYAVKSARGAMYPTLSAFGQLGSNYSSVYREFSTQVNSGTDTLFTNTPGIYTLLPKNATTIITKPNYFRQLGTITFYQAIGLQLNIPILNGRQARTTYERAQINLENSRLQSRADNLTLQQNIYTAYSNAVSALATYNARAKAIETQQYAYDLATKRYQIGILSTIDYITIQTQLFTAKINQVSAKYDYIFKMKVLEFYKGQNVQF
jgi:outer membrane protein